VSGERKETVRDLRTAIRINGPRREALIVIGSAHNERFWLDNATDGNVDRHLVHHFNLVRKSPWEIVQGFEMCECAPPADADVRRTCAMELVPDAV